MTQKKQTSKEAKAEVAKRPDFILTKSGVMFLGHELLGDKLAALMCEAIALDEIHGLATLVIRADGFPIDTDETPLFAAAFADTYSVAINLQQCWDSACKVAMEGDKNLSFLGILWINVLSALGHELDHLAVSTLERELYETMRSDEEGNKELEEAAAISAEQMIVNISRRFDVEIPHVGELGWFGVKIMDLFTNEATKDLPWVDKARKHMEHSVIYDEGVDKQCFSFRDFVKKVHDPESKSGDWDQPTTAVNLTAHLDSGVVEEFKAEPVEDAKIETIELEQVEVEEVIAEEGAVRITTSEQAGTDVKMVDGVDAEGQPTIAMVKVATETVPKGQFVGAGTVDDIPFEPDIVFADGLENDGAGMAEVAAEDTAALAAATADAKAQTTAIDVAMAASTQPVITGTPEYIAANAQPGDIQVPLMNAAGVNAAIEVPLPAPVAAQAAALAGAAATAVPPTQPLATTYTPHNLTPEIQAATIKAVWQTLYHHMFIKCGWQQNPQTGRFFFANAAGILEGVNIQHIIKQFGADNFIMEYDTVSAEGQYAAEMCQGMIRGRTTSQAGLPSYSLYLNINGHRIKRTFMPQNPEKIVNNAYTKSADEAAGGHMIAWVFKDEIADTAPFTEKCSISIKDNVYTVMS